ncbi:MAG: phosphoribosylglycinamide formyltransferase [Myxococcales bacterium]|nr:phosphoribosylglycinamide formyltransferase [Myxococcales bacterium]
MRVVALVSGQGSNLVALLEAIDGGRCAAEVVLVAADRPARAIELAAGRGIATATVPLRKGDDRAAWNHRLADAVAAARPELVVLAGFMRVLAPSFVRRFPRRIVNVHPALLPSFPGANGAADALAAGVRITGCTVHLVDEGVDTGPILAQAAVPVSQADDVMRLHKRIQRTEHRLLPAVVHAVATGALDLDGPTWRDEGALSDMPLYAPLLVR